MSAKPLLGIKANNIIILFVFSFIFAALQFHLNYHTMISPDEFWFISSAYHKYRTQVPYRDFIPYKSVLGYYLFLPPMNWIHDRFDTFVWIRNLITVINVACLFACSLWMTRFYSCKSVLLSLIFLMSTYFFLNLTNDIRVDIFCYWLCLISVLFLLENKFIWAGLVIGFALCISQKAAWYIFSSEAAITAVWLIYIRSLQGIKNIVIYNLSILTIIATYITGWAMISGIMPILNGFILDAIQVYNIDIYSGISKEIYLFIYVNGDPVYLTLWAFTIFSILVIPQPERQKNRLFILIFSMTFIGLFLNYKQLFGYSIIAVMPALYLLYTDFFSWYSELGKYNVKHTSSSQITTLIKPFDFMLLMLFCSFAYAYLFIEYPFVNKVYSLTCILPIITGFYVYNLANNKKNKPFAIYALKVLFYSIIVLSILISAFDKMVPYPPQQGYIYQKNLIHMLSKLTRDGSTYVAGVDILYDKKQPISGNSFLEQNILYLQSPSNKLKKSMLSSLDLNPDTSISNVINAIDLAPVKVIVHTEFIDRLPKLKSYIYKSYEHLWGGIYIYSPTFKAGEHIAQIKFLGNYTLENNSPIIINNKKIRVGQTIFINKLMFHYKSDSTFRLKLLPDFSISNKEEADIPKALFSECSYAKINGRYKCFY